MLTSRGTIPPRRRSNPPPASFRIHSEIARSRRAFTGERRWGSRSSPRQRSESFFYRQRAPPLHIEVRSKFRSIARMRLNESNSSLHSRATKKAEPGSNNSLAKLASYARRFRRDSRNVKPSTGRSDFAKNSPEKREGRNRPNRNAPGRRRRRPLPKAKKRWLAHSQSVISNRSTGRSNVPRPGVRKRTASELAKHFEMPQKQPSERATKHSPGVFFVERTSSIVAPSKRNLPVSSRRRCPR